MRLHKFLNEKGKEYEDIIQKVKDDCQEFVSDGKRAGTNRFLYSGRGNRHDYGYVGTVRKNRKPRDTPLPVHEFFDEYFYKKFGIRARSNSIFCEARSNPISYYGTPYIIFPIGKYEIIGSPDPKLSDLTIYGTGYMNYQDGYDVTAEERKNFKLKVTEKNKEDLDTYKKGDLSGALKSSHEIMLHCKKYYALHMVYYDALLKEL